MRNVDINFIGDNESTRITDAMINNFTDLLKWLKNNEDIPFEATSNQNPTRIFYKHAIKSVEIFE